MKIGKSAQSLEGAATNPGRGLHNIGLDSDTLSKMNPFERMKTVYPAYQDAGQAVNEAVKDATSKGVTLDAGDSAFSTLKSINNPNLQQKSIDEFNQLTKDSGIIDQRKATPEQVLALRRSLQAGANFGPNGPYATLGGVRANLYRAVSSDLHDAVPGLGPIDQHYSDLNSAMKVMQGQTSKFAVTAPSTPIADAAKTLGWQALKYGAGVGGAGLAYRLLRDYEKP